MSKLTKFVSEVVEGYIFDCPGCGCVHVIYTKHPRIKWSFNGDVDKPTFHPSLLRHKSNTLPRCHSFVKDGKIRFLSDCEHPLAGKIVDLPERARQ